MSRQYARVEYPEVCEANFSFNAMCTGKKLLWQMARDGQIRTI